MDESNVFVSATQRWRPSKRSVQIVVVVVLTVALGTGTDLYLTHRSNERKTLQAFNSAMHVASENTSDYAQKLTLLQGVISDAHTNQQKVALYNQLAIVAMDAGDTTLAEHYYVVKHQLDPSSAEVDASIIAPLYEFSGQKQQAIEQYKLSIQYLKTQQSQQKNPREAAYIGGEIIGENQELSTLEGQ